MKPIRRPFHPCISPATTRRGASALGATACTILALNVVGSERAAALDRTWIGGNVNWTDAGSTANWSPADEPDSDDTAIFNTANTVSLGSNNAVNGLTMSGAINLGTNGFDLTVDGLVQLNGGGTTLTVGGSTSLLAADSAAISTGGLILMQGGSITVDEESGDGSFTINASSTLSGNGVISFTDAVLAGTTLMNLNGGVLTATSNAPGDLFGTTASTLTINVSDTDGRIDLDNGVSPTVNISRNDTLDINGQSHGASDPFGGTLNLSAGSTIDMSVAWQMSAGNINANTTGTTVGVAGPAATIAGAAFSLGGGSINLDAIDSLRFSAPFTTTSGTISNSGLVIFNSATTVGAGTDFQMIGTDASLTVEAGAVVNIDDANFNPDGNGVPTNVTTIGSGGILDLDLGTGADESFNGPIFLNGGELDVTTADGNWEIRRSVDVGTSTGTSQINGNAVTFTGTTVTVGASSTLDINAASTWPTGATASVAAGASMRLNSSATLSGASFTGAGTLVLGSTSTVSAATSVATGTFDWDGIGTGTVHTINNGVVFTINSPVFDTDGDMDDPINLGGNDATITMNGPATWAMNGTLTSNSADVGIATISGTSQFVLNGILNSNGDTTIGAPVTFGSSSVTNVASPSILTVDGIAIYSGGQITGAGRYDPSPSNNVISSSLINPTNFNFDRGDWTVGSGATLSVFVSDYDPDTVTNSFDTTITFNSGRIDITSADAEFVMDGTINLNNTDNFIPVWSGEPIAIGNDAGSLDADLNVGGTGISQISSAVRFNSDADVLVAAGSTLVFLSAVNFDTVNGANNAEFTGTGVLEFPQVVNVNESTTLNMIGGTVDLDGFDSTGDILNIDAPFVINAATLRSFGKVNAVGVNTLDINNSVGTGVLTVNLDNPAAEWTLNGPGVMDLVNDNTAATLLAGSDLNVLGTINVTGEVRSTARLDISGTINIQTNNQRFQLAGGNTTSDANTISGGVINGPGRLGANGSRALIGFGTIGCPIDVGASSDVLANDGVLTMNNSLVFSVNNLGTADNDGILTVVPNWDAAGATQIRMQGGQLTGGSIQNNATLGIRGHGLVSSRVTNNTGLQANNPIAPLIFQTAGNNNDWDGVAFATLGAVSGGTLECRDNALFPFVGVVSATGGGTVFTNGFSLDLNLGSTVNLTNGTFKSTNSTAIKDIVAVGSGPISTIEVQSGNLLDFASTSDTTLNGDLRLVTTNGVIRAGASFAGTGSLVIPSTSIVKPANGATANVTVKNEGQLANADTAVGDFNVKDYQQTASGKLEIDMHPSSRDRIIASLTAQLSGELVLKLGGGYVPALNNTFTIVTATGGVSGTFGSIVQPVGMPPGLTFQANYFPTFVELKVVSGTPFETWINSFGSLTNPADKTKGANPDNDELNNLGEFALDGNPASGVSSGKIVGKIAPVGGVAVMTLTIPVRSGAVLDPGDPLGGELVLKQTADELTYRIQASDDLSALLLDVSEVTGPDATAIQAGLPTLNSGWGYRTFRSPGGVAGDPVEFMRAVITP